MTCAPARRRSHSLRTRAVLGVELDPFVEHRLAIFSEDAHGEVKVWDLRSLRDNTPIFSFRAAACRTRARTIRRRACRPRQCRLGPRAARLVPDATRHSLLNMRRTTYSDAGTSAAAALSAAAPTLCVRGRTKWTARRPPLSGTQRSRRECYCCYAVPLSSHCRICASTKHRRSPSVRGPLYSSLPSRGSTSPLPHPSSLRCPRRLRHPLPPCIPCRLWQPRRRWRHPCPMPPTQHGQSLRRRAALPLRRLVHCRDGRRCHGDRHRSTQRARLRCSRAWTRPRLS